MKQLFTTIKKQSEKHEIINPKYALDFLLLVKIPLKLDVNSVSLVQHTSSVCFTHETANFRGLLPLTTNSNA
jgi:hypothetical protein